LYLLTPLMVLNSLVYVDVPRSQEVFFVDLARTSSLCHEAV